MAGRLRQLERHSPRRRARAALPRAKQPPLPRDDAPRRRYLPGRLPAEAAHDSLLHGDAAEAPHLPPPLGGAGNSLPRRRLCAAAVGRCRWAPLLDKPDPRHGGRHVGLLPVWPRRRVAGEDRQADSAGPDLAAECAAWLAVAAHRRLPDRVARRRRHPRGRLPAGLHLGDQLRRPAGLAWRAACRAGDEVRRQCRQGLRNVALDRHLFGRLSLHPVLQLLPPPNLPRRLHTRHRRDHPLLDHPCEPCEGGGKGTDAAARAERLRVRAAAVMHELSWGADRSFSALSSDEFGSRSRSVRPSPRPSGRVQCRRPRPSPSASPPTRPRQSRPGGRAALARSREIFQTFVAFLWGGRDVSASYK
mmetsp:Transcript_21853/g.69463  ORF Transcript_21853/g.69463 Transcript_21853/m.69463 type:complete len:361 (-) Transcript_21853:567-1649(-)